MAQRASTIDQFFQLPEVQRLIAIARSDNALIALDVQRREISWTQFMAWLLDPVRHGPEVAAQRLQPLLDLALQRSPEEVPLPTGESIESVNTVAAEHDAGEAGRLDVFVRCRVGGKTVRILIENKIDATEHHEQLAGYVQHYGANRGDDILLPILIELGDASAGKSTCQWAACLNRQDISGWLGSIAAPPSLVQHYLALLDAWDTAAKLRARYRREIERLREVDNPPDAWRLIQEWLVVNEIPFYQEVLQEPAMVEVLDVHGFKPPDMRGRMKSNHDILMLTKPDWTLPCGRDNESVQIHYECDGRGKMRLDIGVHPYEGSIAKDPQRLEQLSEQLRLKTELHRRVRAMLKSCQLRVDQRWLVAPDETRSHSAGRFVSGLTEDCTPAQHAAFMAGVISTLTPQIDALLAHLRRNDETA